MKKKEKKRKNRKQKKRKENLNLLFFFYSFSEQTISLNNLGKSRKISENLINLKKRKKNAKQKTRHEIFSTKNATSLKFSGFFLYSVSSFIPPSLLSFFADTRSPFTTNKKKESSSGMSCIEQFHNQHTQPLYALDSFGDPKKK